MWRLTSAAEMVPIVPGTEADAAGVAAGSHRDSLSW